MNYKFYNTLQFLYGALSEKFLHFPKTSREPYVCYDSNPYFVKNEYLEILNKVSKLTINEIYVKRDDITNKYSNYPIVKFCDNDNTVCIIRGFGEIIFSYIVFNLKFELERFMQELEYMPAAAMTRICKINNETHIIFHNTEYYKKWEEEFGKNDKKKMLLHLFTKTNSNIITKNEDELFEINKQKLEEIYENKKLFNFDKFEEALSLIKSQ